MATYYVSLTGNNANNGSLATPWRTISYADSHIAPGDTVRLLPGTYTNSNTTADSITTTTSGTAGARITYTADTPGSVFLVAAGTGTTYWRAQGSYVDIIGFDITATSATILAGLIIEGSYATAQKLRVHDINPGVCDLSKISAGIYAGNPTYTNTHVDILACRVWNIGPPSGCYFTHGIYHTVQYGNVYNNICFGNGGQGILFHYNPGHINCANNLCFNNDHGGILVACTGNNGSAHADYMLVENNICINNGGCDGGVSESNGTANNSYKNNLSNNNSVGNLVITNGTQSGNLQVGAGLVNYKDDGTGDYHLTSGSVCRNAGLTAGAPTADYDGKARSGSYDIGPYAYAQGGVRSLTTSVSLSGVALGIRTIGASAALTSGKSRTIAATGAFSGPIARTIPSVSVALFDPGLPGPPASFVLSIPTQGPGEFTCLIESLHLSENIDDAETATFDIADKDASAFYERQAMQIFDSTGGLLLFSGMIERISDQAVPGNTGVLIRSMSCTGNRYRAEKRLWTGSEFNGWMAGDALVKMHHDVLAGEGVLADYAMRYDHDALSFGQGTLAGTVVQGNSLTLAPSGTDYAKTETSTADFAPGTLAGVTPANGALSLTSSLAIKYTATVGANLENNNLYSFMKIWAGTVYTLVAGDEIYVDIWIDSRSPEMKASIDLAFSDGTWMHDDAIYTDFQDRLTIPLRPSTDLQGWAGDTWYQRKCIVPASRAGTVVSAVYLCFEGEKGGDYTAYFKNIKITNSGGGTVRRSIFSGGDTTMKANVPASSSGYTKRKAQVVTVYEQSGSRISPARDISGVGIVRASVLSWQETNATQPSSNTSYDPQVRLSTSIDGGATYQACSNHAAIPSLIVGMNTAGRTLLLKQELNVGGPSPEVTPLLTACSISVSNAAACTKTDYSDIDNSQATLGTGVLTNCTAYADGLYTTGQYRDWKDQVFSSQTLYGLSGAGSPAQGIDKNYFYLRTDGGYDCRSRFDFAGQWQNFIAELDIQIVSSGGGNEYEFVYRTTSWNNNNNTYAYAAGLTASSVTLRRAANGGTPAFTILDNISISLTVGDWYRLKVVVNGSLHQVYVNDVLFITRTDATYGAFGYCGVRLWNGSGVRDSGHYDNFGIIGYDASLSSISNRVTPSLSLGGIVGDSRVNWTAIEPASSTFLVERTLDGGTSWATCTNGGQIPSLAPGYNMTGKSIKFRFTMTNQAINIPIVLQGFSAFITGQYSASGTRIAPALDLTPAGLVGSSSLAWNATTPPGTGVTTAASLNDGAYTSVPVSGSTIPGLMSDGPMAADDFDTNSVGNFTATAWATSGVAPVFSIDTTHSRMVIASGTNGILVWTPLGTAANVSLEGVSDQLDTGGFVFRYIDINNLYYVTFHDASSSTNPNTVTIRKRVASVDTQIYTPTAWPTPFTRGTFHTFKVTMVGNQITVSFDGEQAAQITDDSISAAGWVGLRQNSAVASHWQSVRGQRLGDNASGTLVTTKQTLTSTDPAQNPVVSELIASVRSADIMTGAFLDSTQYAYKSISANIADAAGRSNMYWRIDKTLHLSMKDRAYSPAPWPLTSSDPLFLGTNNPPRIERSSPEYRNRQYVTGAIDLQPITESKKADGTAQSWALSYPVDTLLSVILNENDPQSTGIQGTDTGKQFYAQPGQAQFSSDTSLFIEAETIITVSYIGRVPYTAMKEDTGQQYILAQRDHTTGIVERSEECNGLSAASADAIAQARIDEYARLATTWTYSTSRPGLLPGHFQSVFVPEFGMFDLDVLITSIHTTPWQDGDGNLRYTYDISTTSGANLGTWQRVFALAAK